LVPVVGLFDDIVLLVELPPDPVVELVPVPATELQG
jgi:hypothetical protein